MCIGKGGKTMLRAAEALFLGAHTNKIDAKGRIAAPAEFRKALEKSNIDSDFSGFVCLPSLTGAVLDCGGFDFIARLQAQLDQLDPYDLAREAMELAVMGRARRLPLDKEGRTILPKTFLEHAGLDGRACFVGRGDYFQIWNPDEIEAKFAEAERQAKEARFSVRRAVASGVT